MKKISHREFMTSNKLEVSRFTKALQKKVSIFDKMYSKLEETIEEDKESLLDQLNELDLEIREDMLMELEDQLENNEVVEEPEKKPESNEEKQDAKEEKKEVKQEKPKPSFKKGDTVAIIGGNSKYIGVVGTVAEYHEASGKNEESITLNAHELPNGKGLYNVDNVKATSRKPSPPPAAEPKKTSTDEDILEELWKIKRTMGLSRSFLKECGIKADISGWTVQIGKYTLNRAAVFSYKYNLKKLQS